MAQADLGRARVKSKTSEELEKRVAELERVVKALLVGLKSAEDEIDEALMPEGEYFGHEFRD